jgi:signal peptidase
MIPGDRMAESKYTTPEQIEAMRRELALYKERGGRGRGPSGGRRVLKLTGRIVFTAVVALLVYALVSIQTVKSRGEAPEILGLYLFSVESGSMEPTLDIGSVIVSRAVAQPEKLKQNDIVTFKTRAGTVVTHRIVDVRTGADGGVIYRTKGDNPVNSPDEELLTPDRVIALFVLKVPLT